jgi:hypothetical protein
MRNVTVDAYGGNENYGVYNYDTASTVKIDNSIINGTSYSIYNNAAAFIGTSKLESPAYNSSVLKCVGVYDANYDPYTCP